MTGDVLGQALAYAVGGWPVFPCKPGSKEPDTPHGFKDATTDPGVITTWWRARPDRNVAIATGAPGPDVLDVDTRPGGSGWSAFGRLKRAGLLTGASVLVRTRSGGLHLYFTGTGQTCGKLPRHYLDFKATGGYVLAPPSYVAEDPNGPAGAYELLEQRDADGRLDWQAVRQLLDPPRRAPARTARWDGGELPPDVQRALAADATDRSAALHRLVGACVRAGMDEAAIHQLAASYQPALEKYGARLGTEVERSLSRIGA
jgi:Bifunctional DNA primase/polymerase, N-terminal